MINHRIKFKIEGMKSMSFKLSQEQMMKIAGLGDATLYDARFGWVMWETDKNVVEKFLPPGLVIVDPYAIAFIANYPKTNFSPPYKESALFLAVESTNGKKGIYCMAMPVTDEVALFAGRNIGYPKKIATIKFNEANGVITGSVERYQIPFASFTINENKEISIPPDHKLFEYINPKGATVFNIIAVHSESFVALDMKSYLIRQKIKAKPEMAKICEGSIAFTPSKYDPWYEIPIKKMICALSFRGQTKMMDVNMDQPIDGAKAFPVSFPRSYDAHHYI